MWTHQLALRQQPSAVDLQPGRAGSQSKAVRKAISQAVNVNALNRVVWYGYGQVSAAAIGVANTRYHDADIHYFPYDIAQANAALDAAGLKRGPDGKRFKLRLLFNPFQDPRAADFVRQSLARIGIDAEIESYDFATYVKLFIQFQQIVHDDIASIEFGANPISPLSRRR
ncbi:ABC transporter substrate-binding protein [Paraburkholderia fungorum]|uniref:ABC transporter substrate-binding protein n=1 Tax=Paraburkholderia fungorum TaxID=134537 RepID=UPI0038BAC841